jgi:hypothetical protein
VNKFTYRRDHSEVTQKSMSGADPTNSPARLSVDTQMDYMDRHISFTIYGAVLLTSSKEQPIQKANSKTVCCNLFTEQLPLNTDKNLLYFVHL